MVLMSERGETVEISLTASLSFYQRHFLDHTLETGNTNKITLNDISLKKSLPPTTIGKLSCKQPPSLDSAKTKRCSISNKSIVKIHHRVHHIYFLLGKIPKEEWLNSRAKLTKWHTATASLLLAKLKSAKDLHEKKNSTYFKGNQKILVLSKEIKWRKSWQIPGEKSFSRNKKKVTDIELLEKNSKIRKQCSKVTKI